MANVDETENEMLECFRKCVKEINYYDDMDNLSVEELKSMYFDIATPFKNMLEGFGFKMLSFGFETADEIKKDDPEFLKVNGDTDCAQFVITYDYNGTDAVTAYLPFTKLVANPKWSESERLSLQRQIVMGTYNGFMHQFARHHTVDEFNKVARDILARIGLNEEEINKALTPKDN